ncbi:MAG: sensor histidine kinase [Chthoniobacteraceae bacterium]
MGSRSLPVLIATCIALGVPGKAVEDTRNPPSWVTRTWQTEEGLPQNTINALLQSHDGFLWAGTSAGLARFDGTRFRAFGLRDGLRSVRISTLAEDMHGALWIGTTGGGLSRYQDGRITTFGAAEGASLDADIVSLATTPDGVVWIGTARGLVKWRDGKLTSVGEAEGLPAQQVRALTLDSAGVLWVSVLEQGLFRAEGTRFVKVGGDAPSSGIYSLLGARDGSLWAGSGNGILWRRQDDVWQRYTPADGLPTASFMALTEGGDGSIWISAGKHGLWRRHNARFECVITEGPPSTPGVRTAIADRSGSVWVGTAFEGLKRLSPRVLIHWGATAGLAQTHVTSVAEGEGGSLWIGAASAGVLRADGAHFRKVEDPAMSATTFHTYSVARGDGGTVWTAGEGCLYRFQPGRGTTAFLDPPIRGEAIRALCPDGDTLWLGTYYSTLLKCDGATVKVVAAPGSFRGDITSIVREAENTLWIGTSGGLHRWEHGQIRTWGTEDGLLATSIRALLRDPDGTLWIGTLGGGLARCKDGRFLNITTQQGLIDDVISQIVADDHGALWLGSNRGIMRIERSEIDALAAGHVREVHPIIFGRNEGMLKEQCTGGHSPTAIKTSDGRLLFPTVDGLAEIDPAKLELLPRESAPIVIDALMVDGVPRHPDGPLVLPPGQHRVQIAYTVPGLAGGEWMRFRHRLDGLDRGWVSSSRSRSVTYDALGPGNYAFHVTAADPRGGWSAPEAVVRFAVEPYWWQTWWTRTLVITAVIALSGAAGWWYTHRRHVRRIADLERARRQQAELTHVSRVSLLGELSASLAHELNQPLTAILANAQSAIRFLAEPRPDLDEVRASLHDIAAADRRASEVIRGMRSMIKKGESHLRPCDLNEEVEQVLLLLHSDIIARNVKVSTELSPDLPPVLADAVQLQQVVLNLLVNAADAVRENAPGARRIVIRTRRSADGMLYVSVTDYGRGIAPDMLERIFEPFISTKQDGLGMGLAICQAISKAHGGRLWAENNADGGATFHLMLPAATKETSRQA